MIDIRIAPDKTLQSAFDPWEPMSSPCISLCEIENTTGFCRGCARTLHEISFWTRYSPEERKAIGQQLKLRDLKNA